MDSYAGVILSGGQSRRMGQDKALLKIAGKTLLARQFERLGQLGGQVWVSGSYPGFPSIEDKSFAKGPLAGIASAVRFLKDQVEALLIIAVDMPLLDVETLKNFKSQVTADGAFYVNQAIFPIWLPLTQSVIHCTELAENSDNYALIPWLHQMDAKPLEMPQCSPFMNTNTPEQWQQAICRLQGGSTHGS
ncbi:MAG: putative molybdenum cofactor guanylyltransferase [Candidatus Celerinatantimonas neptuna]|nr:MAG: putative molybdenum cofactor guanylyltransferase [Candidatus Celerinatantimonas neptuna]